MNSTLSSELERFKAVIDSYGSHKAAWPAADKPLMEKLLKSSDVARSMLRQEEKFDVLLSSGDQSVSPSSALLSRVLNDADVENRGSILKIFWPFGSIWQPASGLVMAACIGVIIGISSPNILDSDIDEPSFGVTLFSTEFENGDV
jgi:hypothetical protein